VPSISIPPINQTIKVCNVPSFEDFQDSRENGRTDLRLAEQIYYRIIVLAGFD
jgi:hypothetical protein